MKIVLVTTLGKEIIPSGIVSAVLTQTAEVACDSLSIKIIGGKSLDEIERVYAYKNNKLIFNGYCDCQRTIADERGFETYIYARSSACLLVDNDAFAIVRALKVCLTLMQNRSAFLISLTIFARLKNMKFQAAHRFTVPSICLFQQLPAIQ